MKCRSFGELSSDSTVHTDPERRNNNNDGSARGSARVVHCGSAMQERGDGLRLNEMVPWNKDEMLIIC